MSTNRASPRFIFVVREWCWKQAFCPRTYYHYLVSLLGFKADLLHAGFSETSTGEDLRKGDCTSCAAKEDMSAYWTPSVFFQHENGTFQSTQQVGGMLA